jgi:hypothetical protein
MGTYLVAPPASSSDKLVVIGGNVINVTPRSRTHSPSRLLIYCLGGIVGDSIRPDGPMFTNSSDSASLDR